MSLTPAFTLSALNPSYSGYDPANPGLPYISAQFYALGAYIGAVGHLTLPGQVANDEIIIGYDPVNRWDESITTPDKLRQCVISVSFWAYNTTAGNQFLLIFGLKNEGDNPWAQFFVNQAWQRTERITGDEQVAILLDHPGGTGTKYYQVDVRLATEDFQLQRLGFTGLNGYIL